MAETAASVWPTSSPNLGDGRVGLRRWSDADLDCIREASADPSITSGTSVPEEFTAAEGIAFAGARLWSVWRAREGPGGAALWARPWPGSCQRRVKIDPFLNPRTHPAAGGQPSRGIDRSGVRASSRNQAMRSALIAASWAHVVHVALTRQELSRIQAHCQVIPTP